ncbi:MAG: exopolysaccharide biosynthesis polyprenyl glycosylphosphotransferase [Thiothrix sp.]
MSDTSLAFRLTAASFFQEGESSRQAAPSILYIYAPEYDVTHITEVLNRHGIPHLVNQYNIHEYAGKTFCFYRRSELSSKQLAFLVNAASAGGQVNALLDYLDQQLQFVEVELLHGDYLLESNLLHRKLHRQTQWQRRLLDIAMATSLLALTLPIWILAALAIRLESPGPVFFRQRRTGLFNREFDIIKFRSMCEDAEKNGARWASRNDNRVTRVGQFIRRTRIDELPQLFNVLKGDMSLIGPRPEREVFIHELEKHIPFYRFRHMVKPGVTGLAQVRYTYGASIEDAMHKHRHDMYYLKHQSFWLDLKILLKTVQIVVTGQGV